MAPVRPASQAGRLTSQSPPGATIPARTGGLPMRRILPAVAIAATAAVLAACGSSGGGGGTSGSSAAASPSATAAACSNAGLQKDLFQPGVLTVGTDSPVFTPW